MSVLLEIFKNNLIFSFGLNDNKSNFPKSTSQTIHHVHQLSLNPYKNYTLVLFI